MIGVREAPSAPLLAGGDSIVSTSRHALKSTERDDAHLHPRKNKEKIEIS
jgi:hypothetical protein